jgi:hypothetical protein
MVDRASRDELARAIRRLIAGLAKDDDENDELADGRSGRLRESPDLGVQAVRLAAMQLRDDLHERSPEGPRGLGKAGRRPIAHWILFLKSDLECELPELSGWRAWIVALPDRLSAPAVRLQGSTRRAL